MSETLLVLQHIACEPPAAFEDELRGRGLDLVRVELDEGDPLPDWRDFDGTIVMGGPMGAYEEEAHPWLVGEKRAIREAARAGHPVWGVCLGAQLLAGALGAAVYAGPEAEVGLLAVELTPAAAADPVFGGAPAQLPDAAVARRHVRSPARRDAAGQLARLPQPGIRLPARLRAAVPPRGVARAGRGVGRGAGLLGEPRGDPGAGRARPAGRRGDRARRRHGAARARPVRALARAGRPCSTSGRSGRKRAMEATTKPSAEQVEREIGELLDQERFDPPAGFRDKALIGDESEHEAAARDPRGVVGEAGRGARLVRAMGPGARRLRGALLQVVHRRQAERLVQRPRPPRRGRPRRQGRLPLARRGGRGARRHLRRPAARRQAPRERAQGARHRARRRGRDLPADDPRGGRGDARVRAHRRAAQRRLRRLLAGRRQGAHGVLRGEGADHRRPGAAQGQGGRHQAGGRRVPRRRAVDRDGRGGAQHRRRRRR